MLPLLRFNEMRAAVSNRGREGTDERLMLIESKPEECVSGRNGRS